MSAPAENTLPVPAITVTRTSSSALMEAAHAVRSAIIASLNALRTSGRLSVTYSTTPSRRVRSVSYDMSQTATLLRALRGLRGSHPEDPELRRRYRRVEARRQRERQGAAGLRRVENPVVPQPRGRIVRRPFEVVLVENRLADLPVLLVRQLPVLARQLVALDRGEHARGLLAAHDGAAGVRPHPEEPRLVRAAAHAVIPRAERPADDDGELRHDRVGDRVHHLGAVLRDAAALVLLAHHEPGDVLQEDQRDAAQVAELDEVRVLERRLGEQHAVVADDADQEPVQPREARR